MMQTIRRTHDETGIAAVFIVFIAVALMAMAGLVVDGGYAMAGNRRLTNQAAQAARVGADALDQDSLRDGGAIAVDRGRAISAVRHYLANVGAPTPEISFNGGTVTVKLKDEQKTSIMSAVGITTLPIQGQASAESIDQDGP